MESLTKQLANGFEKILPSINSLNSSDFNDLLNKLSHAYYHEQPIVDDSTYDTLESVYEEKFGKRMKTGSTPTKLIRPSGGVPLTADLPVPMFGLEKLKTEKDIERFKRRFPDVEQFVVTDKLDGNSALYDSKSGLYKRGDEVVGTDISYILPHIKLPKSNAQILVRGEIVMALKTFNDKYSGEMKNARNMISGLCNSKEAEISRIQDMDLVAYHTYTDPPMKQSDILVYLQELNFNIPSFKIFDRDELTAENLTRYIKIRKNKSPYEIDGVVISADIDMHLPMDKNPEHVVAFKILGDTAITTVLDLIWTVGKFKIFTPVLSIEPTTLEGVVINRVTCHNARWLFDREIGRGAKILLTRSGGAIPKVLDVVEKGDEPSMPENSEWIDNGEGEYVNLRLTNNTYNSEYDVKQLVAFFVARNIKGLKFDTLVKLYNHGLTTLSDIFDVSKSELLKIPGIAAKNADKIWNAIKTAILNAPLYEIMVGSCIFNGFGHELLRIITEAIPQEELLSVCDEKGLENMRVKISQIKGFKTRAQKFVDALPTFQQWLKNHSQIVLMDNVAEIDIPQSKDEQSWLYGQNIVFTGYLPGNDTKDLIGRKGGKILLSFNKKATLLVTNTEKLTGKLKKAREQGIKIVSKEEFDVMMKEL